MAYNIISGYGGSSAYKYPATVGNEAKDNTEFLKAKSSLEQDDVEEQLFEEETFRGNASIENVAISFGIYDESAMDLFQFSSIDSNDMENAISGMQKDQILREYQYFVGDDLAGNKNSIIASTEDGLVIKKN